MAVLTKIKQNDNLVRIVSALALAAIAIRSFVNGKRLRGLVVAGGAVAVGSTTSTLEPTPVERDAVEDTDGVDTTEPTSEDNELRCGVCDEAIVPGESRRPDEHDDIVHEACL